MAKYGLIKTSDNSIVKEADSTREFRDGNPPTLQPNKGLKWLPVVLVEPPVDNSIEIKADPVIVVTATEITKTWTVRAKTALELSDEKDSLASDVMRESGLVALIKALNDGSFVPNSSYTLAQMKAIVRAKL